MAPRKPNAKAVAANEKKAASKAVKDAAEAREREKQTSAEWNKGANTRKASKEEEAAQKADEAARKRREKAELLAAEEAAMGPSGSLKKAAGGAAAKNKKKGKKKDELSMLEDSLVGDAEKKSRQAKRAERLRKEREEKAAAERATRKSGSGDGGNAEDPLLANTDAMIGGAAEYSTGDGSLMVGRSANVAAGGDDLGTGIDGALGAMKVGGGGAGGGGGDDSHPEKRVRALHKAFEERMLPQMKEEYPGLRLGQYKEKIFALWKKSPENPMNWPQSSHEPHGGADGKKKGKK